MTASSSSAAAPALLRAAFVRRVHGIRGEVKAEMLGGDARRFRSGTVLVSERDGRRLTVRSARPLDGADVLLSFDEVHTREEAATLSGGYLCVTPDQSRSLGSDEWFVWQLVGLRVRAADGTALGTVTDVESHPASDVLVVVKDGAEERYPLVRQWVESVDVDGGEIVLTPWQAEEG